MSKSDNRFNILNNTVNSKVVGGKGVLHIEYFYITENLSDTLKVKTCIRMYLDKTQYITLKVSPKPLLSKHIMFIEVSFYIRVKDF